MLEVWSGPGELRVGTQEELKTFCALLFFTLTLHRGGSAVWQPEQRTLSLGSACGSAEEVEPPKEQSRALPAQKPKTPRTWGSISNLRTYPAPAPSTLLWWPCWTWQGEERHHIPHRRAFCADFKELTALFRFC